MTDFPIPPPARLTEPVPTFPANPNLHRPTPPCPNRQPEVIS